MRRKRTETKANASAVSSSLLHRTQLCSVRRYPRSHSAQSTPECLILSTDGLYVGGKKFFKTALTKNTNETYLGTPISVAFHPWFRNVFLVSFLTGAVGLFELAKTVFFFSLVFM